MEAINEARRSGADQRTLIRSVALPSEHGGWGFLLEPIVLALMVAPSWLGALLGVAALGAFLTHQPLKTAIKDRLKGRRPPRAIWAERFAVGYGVIALVPLAVVAFHAPAEALTPLLLATPFALTQLVYDARNQSRRLLPEVCGAAALAMIAPAIAMVGGWTLLAGLGLWLVVSARALTSILYVRARLGLARRKAVALAPVGLVHAAAIGVVAVAVFAQAIPWLAIAVFVVLAGRAAWGLAPSRQSTPVPIIGLQEMGFGLMTVVIIAFGYRALW